MRWLTAVLVGMAMAAGCATAEAAQRKLTAEELEKVRPRPIPRRVIPLEDFAATPKTGNHTGVIRNLDDWNEVFAVVKGSKKPAAPDEAFFANESLLVVVRLTPVPPKGKKYLSAGPLNAAPVYRVEDTGVVLSGEISVSLKISGLPPEGKKGTFKSVLLVAVQKDEVPPQGVLPRRSVSFYE